MSMDTAPENNVPPETGLRSLAEVQAELARVTEQWQQAEAHNNDVCADLVAVRQWAATAHRAAINRLAQGSPDPRYWQGQLDAAQAVETLVKAIV